MEVIVTFLVLVIGFIGLDLGSIRFGADFAGANSRYPRPLRRL